MPSEFMLLMVAFAGLCFGSFITMASWRLPRGEDLVFKPSHCTACNHKLTFEDLFPVLSWVLARGKCRHCGVKVHFRYPLTELATMGGFLAVYSLYGISFQSFLLMGLLATLILMIVVDFEHYIIPDSVHVILIPLGVMYGIVTEKPVEDMITGALVGFAIGCALCYGYKWLRGKEGLGFGDVKFLGTVGVWLGVMPLVPFLFLGGVLGIVTAGLWNALKRGELFPFGPALAVSMLVCVMLPELPAGFWQLGGLVNRVLMP